MLVQGFRIAGRPVLLAFLLLAATTARAPAAPKAQPRTQEVELAARKAFAGGSYDKALDLYAQLYAETLHPVHLRNIGRCHQKMRNAQKAIDAFNDYLAKSPRVAADDRKEVDGYIKEMDDLLQAEKRAAAVPPPPPPTAQPVPPPDRPLTKLPAQPTPPTALIATSTPPPTKDQAPNSTPIYKEWWFWTGVAAAVVGAVAIAVSAGGGSSRPDCPARAMGNCL